MMHRVEDNSAFGGLGVLIGFSGSCIGIGGLVRQLR
jgi:hypothetical protein